MLSWTAIYLVSEWVIRLIMLVYVPQNRTPSAARAWLLLIFVFPWGGLVLYAFFGRAHLPRRRMKVQEHAAQTLRTKGREFFQQYESQPQLPQEFLPAAGLAEHLDNFGILGGNCVELLPDYEGAIDRLVADIGRARHHVHLLYYIFADDRTGGRVADAVIEAAKRGVKCRVLMDSLGSRRGLRTLAPRMRAAGVEVLGLLPVRLLSRDRVRLDLRNHRKIAVLDAQVAYVGSQNLVNADFKKGITNTELVARLTGPVVLQLQAVFLADHMAETSKEETYVDLFPEAPLSGASAVQALPSGPGFPHENTQCLIVALLHAARRRVVITTPYFVPDVALLQSLKTAALRGVEVHLVVSKKADQVMVGLAQRSYYDELLGAGIHIHQYKPGLLHAKHVSVDDAVALVGSSNLDIRSFALNAEISVVVYDPQVVAALRQVEERNIADSELLSPEEWAQRPLLTKVAQNTARLVDSVL
jgi:cardiolipin synthase A/B